MARSYSSNRAQNAVLRRLAEHGGWIGRDQLARGLDWTEQRVDDELADLVVEGRVIFNGRAREYRLGGSTLARQAMQTMLAEKLDFRLIGRPSKTRPVMEMGLARRAVDYTGGELLVMCDLEMPYAPKSDPAEVVALCERLAAFDRDLEAELRAKGGQA